MEEMTKVATLTIGKNHIPVKLLELDQNILNFYPENPRVYSALNSDGTVPSQEDIEEHMKKLNHVRELASDIESNGGLIEEVIVRDGDYVVLEGNSRLAAYRILNEKDPIKWAKMKCKVLPNNIDENLIFKLIGQYHIKGKKPWEAYEQASYLWRRSKSTKIDIEYIADELGIDKSNARNMVATVEMMKENGEPDNGKYSYYFEYIKNASLKKYRETIPEIDEVVVDQIKKGDILKAEDIRMLGKVAKVRDKQSKKLIKEFVEGNITLYDAYEAAEEGGKLEPVVNKLKAFRNYINTDSFAKNVRSSDEVYKNARYEMDKILKRINDLEKKWDKDK